jgi:hypothetical protein
MPSPLPIAPIPTPVQKLPVTPLIGDLLVSETVDTKVAVNATHPEFGTPHPNSAKWPNHKFCWAEPGDKGVQRWVYVADRENQHLYNWEIDDSAERPTVKQTFLIPRDEYAAGGVVYTAPEFIDTDDYQIVATTQSRSDIAKLDNLYVVVQVVWEDVTAILSGQEFDPDTGNLYTYSKEKVPAGTPGQQIDNSGEYAEVQPVNSLWSIKTVKQAQGLAGAASGGVATRDPYPIIVNYSWPAVLNASNPFSQFRPPLQEGGYGKAITMPNYLRQAYDGPCVGIVYEQWTKTVPNVTTVGQVMIPAPITWDGALLQVSIPPTLHQGFEIFENSGTNHPVYKWYDYRQYISPTYPADWPQYIDSKLDIRPSFGGYFSRRIRIYNPYYTDLSLILLASVLEVTATTAHVTWVTGASGTASVYIRAHGGSWGSPTATGLTGNDYTFTGLTAGTAYDIKVVVGALTSNVLEMSTILAVPVFSNGPFSATILEDAAMSAIDYNATGGSLTFSADGLPAGVSINATTGVVSGTPTPDLSETILATVTVANDAGSVEQTLTLNYAAKPTVSPSQVFSFEEGELGISFQPVATNSPTTWSQSTVSSTPDAGSPFFTIQTGLSFNASTGLISGGASGTDLLSRVWVLNITAGNAAGNRGAVPITINYTAKPTITAAQSFSRAHNAAPIADITIAASNSPTYWTYDGTVSRPAHPINPNFFLAETGLVFDTDTGVISGSAGNHSQNIGTWVLQFTAYNDAGDRGSVNVTIILT